MRSPSLALLKKDKGYRRYASTVQRVLEQFDTAVEEWADYISFLGRLLKVAIPSTSNCCFANDCKALSVKPSGFTEIPHKFLVAKRLSQCLNPVLPSGVHQKTLEVYSYVFSTLGVRFATPGLFREIIWLMGYREMDCLQTWVYISPD